MEGKANYLTLKEAAEQLGVHPNTLRNWERRGVIRLDRLPGSRYRRVPVYEVQRVERELTQPAPPVGEQAFSPDDWHVRIDWPAGRWTRSGDVLILLPPPDDPDLQARAEKMALEIQAELATVEPQGTLEEAMRELRGPLWSG
jgi:MerR family transcriptional regulator, copper efflux regulator